MQCFSAVSATYDDTHHVVLGHFICYLHRSYHSSHSDQLFTFRVWMDFVQAFHLGWCERSHLLTGTRKRKGMVGKRRKAEQISLVKGRRHRAFHGISMGGTRTFNSLRIVSEPLVVICQFLIIHTSNVGWVNKCIPCFLAFLWTSDHSIL